MLLAKQLSEAHWEPTIGDPTVLGWLTAGIYALAAICCLMCWWRRSVIAGRRGSVRYGLFWLVMALGMAVLAVNKQLDLQGLVYVTGRNTAIRNDWFDRRREVMKLVVIGVAVVGMLSVAGLLLAMRGLWGRLWPAVLGVAMIAGFAVLRTAELLHIGRLSRGVVIGPVHISHLVELLAAAVIVASALRCMNPPKTADATGSHPTA